MRPGRQPRPHSSRTRWCSPTIPGVEKFERLQQVSPKNDYRFGFSMEFADQAAYSGYNDHPDHVAFVRDRWIPEVEAFLEIDYKPYGRQPIERPGLECAAPRAKS